MQSYTDKRSRLSSPYFRLGMLDGHRALPHKPESDSLFTTTANSMLAYDAYKQGYLAGLDARPMPHYEVKPNIGRTGGELRSINF